MIDIVGFARSSTMLVLAGNSLCLSAIKDRTLSFDALAEPGQATGGDMDRTRSRQRAARDARAYVAGEIAWDDFMDAHGDTEDPEIGDLVDIIEHEPQRGGFLGVGDRDWETYVQSREDAIRALESETGDSVERPAGPGGSQE